jgi:hypothetical protein
MKTVQTKPDCTLGFVEVEPEWFNFKTRFDGSWWLYGSNKSIPDNNPFSEVETFEDEYVYTLLVEKVKEFKQISVIGKLSEITEEQARELMEVDKEHIGFGRICNYLYGLKESAKAVGIEEKDFDKYLVVKL